MYTVIACPRCENPQIVDGKPETTTCNRCRKSIKFKKARKFHTTETLEEAKRERSQLLAKIGGLSEEYEKARKEGVLDADKEERVGEDELLEQEGIDEKELQEAEERARRTNSSKPKKERVVEAIESLDEATEENIIERADDAGVPPDYTRKTIKKLCRNGEAMRDEGEICLL